VHALVGEIDPQRLAAELAADADVVRSLRENGDDPTIVRPIDVRFEGDEAAVLRLRDAADAAGWTVIQIVELDEASWALDVQRAQTTDEEALRLLTVEALRIEQTFGVRYDGWGTVAQSA
jgi:hypothetical protein